MIKRWYIPTKKAFYVNGMSGAVCFYKLAGPLVYIDYIRDNTTCVTGQAPSTWGFAAIAQ